MKRTIICLLLVLAISIGAISFANAYTAVYPYSWNKNSLTCYFNADILSNYGTQISNYVRIGVMAWNNTDAPSISVGTLGSSDISVDMDNYGYTGWDGYNNTNYSPSNIINYSITYLNTCYLSGYLSEYNLWRAIACHETGHALGLNHYILAPSETEEDSIMKSNTIEYYNVSGTTKIYAPCTPDISAINAKY